ncbi:hypothetical protein RJG79_10425 [Mycoplasmatota bacterium WC44]
MNQSVSRFIIILLLFVMFVGGIGMYVITTGIIDLYVYIAIIIAVLFTFYLVRGFRAVKKGEVLEDELSKKVMNKAAARSFYISLYLWIFLNYKFDFESEVMLFGVGGMTLIFILNYILITLNGRVD